MVAFLSYFNAISALYIVHLCQVAVCRLLWPNYAYKNSIRSIAIGHILIGIRAHIPMDSIRVFSQTITLCAPGFVNHNVFQCRPSQQWCTRISRHDWLAARTSSLSETCPGAVTYSWAFRRQSHPARLDLGPDWPTLSSDQASRPDLDERLKRPRPLVGLATLSTATCCCYAPKSWRLDYNMSLCAPLVSEEETVEIMDYALCKRIVYCLTMWIMCS